MGSTKAWFALGQDAGEAAGRNRSQGLPFLSRDESWEAAICSSRPTLRRWQQFQDGWITGFCRRALVPNAAGTADGPPHCTALLASGQQCTREAKLILGGQQTPICVAHAWPELLTAEASEPARILAAEPQHGIMLLNLPPVRRIARPAGHTLLQAR
jgi:hypothetical protein